MRGLIIKDLLLIRKALSWVYLFPLVVIVVCGSAEPGFFAMTISFLIPVCFGFLVYNAMLADESSHWARLEKGLPIKASTAVLGKYVLSGIVIGASLVVNAVIALGMVAFAGIDPLSMAVLVCMGTAFGIVYLAVLIPAVLRFGISKGPVVFIGCIFMLALVLIVLNKIGVSIDIASLLLNPAALVGASVGACVVLVPLSYLASLKAQSGTKRDV